MEEIVNAEPFGPKSVDNFTGFSAAGLRVCCSVSSYRVSWEFWSLLCWLSVCGHCLKS